MSMEIITSDLLAGTRHAFFTRKGGASSGVFRGLNCGAGSSDQDEVVAMNRARVASAIGVAPERLLSTRQVHSTAVAVASDAGWTTRPEADATVTVAPALAIGVLTADCAPILFADPVAGVVAAAHAGWRGALEGVIEATVEKMIALGARRADIRAAVGPTISQRAYEVGPEFFERFRTEEAGYDRFFIPAKGNRFLFDLPGFVLGRLRDEGLEAEWVGHCTYSDAERYYSFRRATHAGEPDYGRLISVIRL